MVQCGSRWFTAVQGIDVCGSRWFTAVQGIDVSSMFIYVYLCFVYVFPNREPQLHQKCASGVYVSSMFLV